MVHRSGERKSLRVWDPNGELARGFLGFTWFPIQMDYRVTGRFIPDATPREMQVMNTFGDLDTYKTEGVVEFTLRGQTLRLRPFTTRPKRFYFVFRDASGGQETYAAARFLYSDLRDDGTTVLDFNQAYNPPCAFNPFTTCPIPLPENRLGVKILRVNGRTRFTRRCLRLSWRRIASAEPAPASQPEKTHNTTQHDWECAWSGNGPRELHRSGVTRERGTEVEVEQRVVPRRVRDCPEPAEHR